jgi:flavin reductase (DIM6/NTAB) family NADH-FMN oxidoreductase RutF
MDRIVPPAAEVRQRFRAAGGQVPGGVAVVVTLVEGEPHAATASSGVVASLDPPLYAVFFAVGSRMHDRLAASGVFTANLLRPADHALARRFANPARPTGWAGLAGLDLVRRDPAPPVLAGAAAWFDCRVRRVVPVGDHACFVGEVVECGRDAEAPPLVYCRGRFHALGRPVAPARWSSLERDDLIADW